VVSIAKHTMYQPMAQLWLAQLTTPKGNPVLSAGLRQAGCVAWVHFPVAIEVKRMASPRMARSLWEAPLLLMEITMPFAGEKLLEWRGYP